MSYNLCMCVCVCIVSTRTKDTRLGYKYRRTLRNTTRVCAAARFHLLVLIKLKMLGKSDFFFSSSLGSVGVADCVFEFILFLFRIKCHHIRFVQFPKLRHNIQIWCNLGNSSICQRDFLFAIICSMNTRNRRRSLHYTPVRKRKFNCE